MCDCVGNVCWLPNTKVPLVHRPSEIEHMFVSRKRYAVHCNTFDMRLYFHLKRVITPNTEKSAHVCEFGYLHSHSPMLPTMPARHSLCHYRRPTHSFVVTLFTVRVPAKSTRNEWYRPFPVVTQCVGNLATAELTVRRSYFSLIQCRRHTHFVSLLETC